MRFKQPGRAIAALGPGRERRDAEFFPPGRPAGAGISGPGPMRAGGRDSPGSATGHGASAGGRGPQATSPSSPARIPRPVLPGTASLRRGVRACAGAGDAGLCPGPAALRYHPRGSASRGSLALSEGDPRNKQLRFHKASQDKTSYEPWHPFLSLLSPGLLTWVEPPVFVPGFAFYFNDLISQHRE